MWGAAGCGEGAHITAVGDQLAEEDLLLGVERVNDDVHELVHVGLELELLAILLGGSRSSSIVGLDADVDASPRAGGLRGRAERSRLLLEGGGLRAERGENEEELHIGTYVFRASRLSDVSTRARRGWLHVYHPLCLADGCSVVGPHASVLRLHLSSAD